MKNAKFKIQYPNLGWLQMLRYAAMPRTYNVQLPESWEEVPTKKLKQVFGILMEHKSDRKLTQLRLLKCLLPLRNKLFFSIRSEDFVTQLEPLVSWMLDEPLNVAPATVVRTGLYRWQLPASDGRDMSLGQYFAIEHALEQMRLDPELPALLASILRPVGEETNLALEQEGLLPAATRPVLRKWATRLSKLHPSWGYYVMRYWTDQRKALRVEYPHFFAKPKKKKGEEYFPPIDWESVPARIAALGIFGNVAQVQRTPLRTYLAWGEQQAKAKEPSLQDIIKANHQKFLN